MQSNVRVSRFTILFAIAAISGLITAGAAAAQPAPAGTGTRIGSVVRHAPPNNARQVASEFGECVVKKHRLQAVQWLEAKTHEARARLQSQVFDEDCLEKEVQARNEGIELTLPAEIAKFAIAEPLARDTLEQLDPAVLSKAPRLTYLAPDPASFAPKSNKPTAKQMADAEKSRHEATVDLAFEVYGECVVRQNPLAARQLLNSPVSSVGEANAFGALMPSFSECLPKNQQFTATRAMLRGTVALAYYRLSKVAQDQRSAR